MGEKAKNPPPKRSLIKETRNFASHQVFADTVTLSMPQNSKKNEKRLFF